MLSIFTVKPVYQNLPWVYDVLLLVRFTLGYTLCSLKEKPKSIEIPTWRVSEIKDTLALEVKENDLEEDISEEVYKLRHLRAEIDGKTQN